MKEHKPKRLCIHNNDPDTCPKKGERERCIVEARSASMPSPHPPMVQTVSYRGGKQV